MSGLHSKFANVSPYNVHIQVKNLKFSNAGKNIKALGASL